LGAALALVAGVGAGVGAAVALGGGRLVAVVAVGAGAHAEGEDGQEEGGGEAPSGGCHGGEPFGGCRSGGGAGRAQGAPTRAGSSTGDEARGDGGSAGSRRRPAPRHRRSARSPRGVRVRWTSASRSSVAMASRATIRAPTTTLT